MILASGTKLGPYEIVASIGAGGMGEVYRAKDTRLGRAVAIKVLNKEHMQRFEQEARAIAALNHLHICTLHDIGPNYLVMEYVDGAAIKGPLPVEQAVRLALQIAGALDEAHKNGILHRDLKPGNIMVTMSGTTKLLDFGLAKLATGAEVETASTIEGTVMGTPAYMSPEQAQGRPVDVRSDIFSFGAVLYEIISGNRAFGGTSTAQVLSAVLRDEPKALETLPQLDRIVMRCLAKQPAQRFQAMTEVMAALEQVASKPAEQQPSIAVLPFVNMSGDKEQEYFSDGLAEEIINALAQIPGLKVIARTSAFAFKGKQEDITKIAEALRVNTILEGSVRKAGNRIRVTAQLITAADGSHLWSERYDRDMTDVFAIQDEISRAIATKLQVCMSETRQFVRRHTDNIEAYSLYFRGRHHFYKSTPEGLAKAREYYENAIAVDPDYALAWYGLSKYYWLMGFGGHMKRQTARERSGYMVLKALELNEMLPETHAMLGTLQASAFDWKGAEREFRLGLELDPASEEVLINYSWCYLIPMLRLTEAIAAIQRVLELDPLSVISHTFLGWFYSFVGQWDHAIKHYRTALEFDPGFHRARMFLGLAFIEKGMIDEGILAYETGARLLGEPPILAYAKAGQIQKAKDLLGDLPAHAQKAYVPASFAQIYFALGEINLGFDWMEKAVDEHDEQIYYIYAAKSFDPLRSHLRYHALLRKMNLEP